MAANNISNGNHDTQNCNSLVQALMTDQYQITMAYAYWQNDRTYDRACFDLFFRKNPFGGEFTLYAGLSECVKFIQNFRFTDSDISYLKSVLPPDTQDGFFEHLRQLDCSDVELYSIAEGMVVFPRVPLIRLEGPLGVLQLLETPFLNLINYASLVATNAARFRMAAGPNKSLLEFGLRRAQGPDGGLTASKYSYIGGFDGTSNVLAGKLFGIPLKGTNAHSMIMSFASMDDLKCRTLQPAEGSYPVEFASICERWLGEVCKLCDVLKEQTIKGELAAFIAYARSFPKGFLALVDTYDVMKSGLVNFCAVALALDELGYRPIGIRIDSGDLAYQSIVAREVFTKLGESLQKPWFPKMVIVASNDINEDTLLSLNQQGHSIDSFGIGTHLVTCQKQPALGCVFKLVQVNELPRIKLSHDIEKVTIPGRKQIHRLYGQDGRPLVDLMQQMDEDPPEQGKSVLCRHPFEESKRAYVRPAKVVPLHQLYWKDGKVCQPISSLEETRAVAKQSLQMLREDHKRALNPTPYKVSVSDNLYQFLHELWLQSAPIEELH
ncbi:nicotinate phosphoribosyltransferase-like [Amphiura filiformis]|uniref:nicotinate phosphoribosyltransferase-like n=1 Tax=Amphiura filiformis TaxID=82378 RepID=UPI003B21C7A8